MKKFEMPAMEVEKFEIADIITTSDAGCTNDSCGGNLTERD